MVSSACSFASDTPQNTCILHRQRTFRAHTKYAEVRDIESVAGPIEVNGQRPLQPSASEPGRRTVRLTPIRRELVQDTRIHIHSNHFEPNGTDYSSYHRSLIPELSNK